MSTETEIDPAAETENTPKPKKEYIPFRSVAPAEVLDSQGLLNTIELPTFDANTHERLKPADFANDILWLRYKAQWLRNYAANCLDRAERYEREANGAEKFGGDMKKRAQVKKLQKLAEGLAALREQLAADGVDVDELLDA